LYSTPLCRSKNGRETIDTFELRIPYDDAHCEVVIENPRECSKGQRLLDFIYSTVSFQKKQEIIEKDIIYDVELSYDPTKKTFVSGHIENAGACIVQIQAEDIRKDTIQSKVLSKDQHLQT
jgi:hypothetical protein